MWFVAELVAGKFLFFCPFPEVSAHKPCMLGSVTLVALDKLEQVPKHHYANKLFLFPFCKPGVVELTRAGEAAGACT